VCLAGEPLPQTVVDQIYQEWPQVEKVYDLYGPTETTVYSTYALRTKHGRANIGRPLWNEKIYILDSYGQPAPIGVTGELHVGGAGVGRGYLNRPELTAEKFVSNPFEPGTRLYKTGDLARYWAGGAIEFLGRRDHQVKIRGFRIELGEIESVLRQHPNVANAVVTVLENVAGGKQLVAYLVAKEGPAPVGTELRGFLKKTLPEHMIPSRYVELAELPLTPNGKVDRRGLPVPEERDENEARPESEPGTATEMALAEIWGEVLGRSRVGVDENFFASGGHSILAIQVMGRVQERFECDLPLRRLFENPTIRDLARVIEETLLEEIQRLSDEEAQELSAELEPEGVPR
jgi:acyl carrier protein